MLRQLEINCHQIFHIEDKLFSLEVYVISKDKMVNWSVVDKTVEAFKQQIPKFHQQMLPDNNRCL